MLAHLFAAKILESKINYQNYTYTFGNVCGLGIYIHGTMKIHSSKARELAFDATFETNSSG